MREKEKSKTKSKSSANQEAEVEPASLDVQRGAESQKQGRLGPEPTCKYLRTFGQVGLGQASQPASERSQRFSHTASSALAKVGEEPTENTAPWRGQKGNCTAGQGLACWRENKPGSWSFVGFLFPGRFLSLQV